MKGTIISIVLTIIIMIVARFLYKWDLRRWRKHLHQMQLRVAVRMSAHHTARRKSKIHPEIRSWL